MRAPMGSKEYYDSILTLFSVLDSQLALPRFTASGTRIPVDPSGNEMCLLFIKYGRCRFRKKCNRSHWIPPLPDEELPPLPPPLPTSPPPPPDTSALCYGTDSLLDSESEKSNNSRKAATVDCRKSENTATGKLKPTELLESDPHNCYSGAETSSSDTVREHAQTDSDVHIHKTKISPRNDVSEGNDFTSEEILNPTSGLSGQNELPVDQRMMPEDKQITQYSLSGGHNEEQDTAGCEDADIQLSPWQCIQQLVLKPPKTSHSSVDVLITKAFHGKSRFGKFFGPSLKEIGATSTYKSSVTEHYRKLGAYVNCHTGKLEAHNLPATKAGRKFFKLFKRIHWRTHQRLQESLSHLPTAYHLTTNLARVNFNRLRPYVYLLIHKGLFLDHCQSWKPSAFSCLVADTLIALFEYKNISPSVAEQKLCAWGARPVRARQSMSHLWTVITKSSWTHDGVAPEVVKCEQDVCCRKLSALDYAVACSLAARHLKARAAEDEQELTTLPESVKKGLNANRDAKACLRAQKYRKVAGMRHGLPSVATTSSHAHLQESLCTSRLSTKEPSAVRFEDSPTPTPLIMNSQRCSKDGVSVRTVRGRHTENSVEQNIPDGLCASTPGNRNLSSTGSQSGRRKRSRQFKGLADEEKTSLAVRFKNSREKSSD